MSCFPYVSIVVVTAAPSVRIWVIQKPIPTNDFARSDVLSTCHFERTSPNPATSVRICSVRIECFQFIIRSMFCSINIVNNKLLEIGGCYKYVRIVMDSYLYPRHLVLTYYLIMYTPFAERIIMIFSYRVPILYIIL